MDKLERWRKNTGGPGLHGTLEFRAGRSLILVLTIDWRAVLTMPATPAGTQQSTTIWPNAIQLQVCHAKVDDQPSACVIRALLADLTSDLPVSHGLACLSSEYSHKNILSDSTGSRAVGLDVRSHLPGIYWGNHFGPAYLDLIGKERLLSAPAYKAEQSGAGVTIWTTRDPQDWDKTDSRLTAETVIEHLGSEYFFSKEQPLRRTRGLDLEHMLRVS